MPHLQIDHYPNFESKKLLQLLVEEFCKIETVDPAAVKAYARLADQFEPGHHAPAGFVHLTICVLEGRNKEVLEKMSDRLYAIGKTYLQNNQKSPVSWTLEIREMTRHTYKKGTVG
jgi:5-carboxymethyl-2-hydroxymuconate isomerase